MNGNTIYIKFKFFFTEPPAMIWLNWHSFQTIIWSSCTQNLKNGKQLRELTSKIDDFHTLGLFEPKVGF